MEPIVGSVVETLLAQGLLAVVILLAELVVIAFAFRRGEVIPGWLYRAEVARGDKAAKLAERNTQLLARILRILERREKRSAE